MTNEKAIEVYNKLNFLFSILIPLLDEAEETTQPMREVKFHLKRLREEAEKKYKVFYEAYQNGGFIEQEDGKQISSYDIWRITEKSYEYLFNLVLKSPPHEIASLMNLHKSVQEKGIDINQISFEYNPIKV